MQMQMVELLHTLCASEPWAQCFARWAAAELASVADGLEGRAGWGGSTHSAAAVLAVLGGVFETPRIGGRATAKGSGGLLSTNEVVVLGRALRCAARATRLVTTSTAPAPPAPPVLTMLGARR